MNRRHFLKASSLLALGACRGQTLTAPDPIPDAMPRYSHRFDIRRFGGQPRFVNSTNRGRDNSAAFADAIGEMSITKTESGSDLPGTHKLYVPSSEYGYWMGEGPNPITFTSPYGVHLQGDGKRASRLVYEPEGAPAGTHHRLVTFDAGAVQGQCSVEGISAYGFGSEYVGTRQPKQAFATLDGSEIVWREVGVNDWNSLASTGVSSEGFGLYGKEIQSFYDIGVYADRPVGIHANPYEPTISLDGFNFHNTYLGVTVAGEAGIEIDPNLRVLNFDMTGVTNIVGNSDLGHGKWGIHCEDPAGTAEWVNFSISGTWRCEQMNDPTGASLYLNKAATHPAHNLLLQGMNLGFQQRGIVLRGTTHTLIQQCAFLHQGGVGVPLALDINATCRMTTAHHFEIPAYGSPLVSTTGLAVIDGGGAPPAGYQLPPSTTWN